MWAVLAVISAVGAAILGTAEWIDVRGKGKRRKVRVVFTNVSQGHRVEAFFQSNKPH